LSMRAFTWSAPLEDRQSDSQWNIGKESPFNATKKPVLSRSLLSPHVYVLESRVVTLYKTTGQLGNIAQRLTFHERFSVKSGQCESRIQPQGCTYSR
jgi:hypothetical protein